MTVTKTEPVITTAGLTALTAAVIALAVAFWPDLLTDAQQDAILSLVGVVGPIAVGLIARGKVTPNSKVAERVDDGRHVIAGEANDLVDVGDLVRTISPRRAED